MKIIYLILILCVSLHGYSQEKKVTRKVNRTYITIQNYKKQYGINFTKVDSLNFIIKGRDTLVMLTNGNLIPTGVKVLYEPKDSLFLDIYEDIVFKKYNPQYENSSKKTKMRYWKTAITIYFTESVNDNVKIELTKFANYLSNNIDSLNIKFAQTIEASNYLVYGYNSQSDIKYEERINGSINDYYIQWDGNQRIYNCKLQLNENHFKNEGDYILKTKKLFLASLGHFQFTNLLTKDNLFSSFYLKNQDFTEIDLELIKYHYSYGICKGTDLVTFQEQHKRAKKQIELLGVPMYFIHPN